MKDQPKRLGDAELEIMQILWAAPQPEVTAGYILERLQKTRPWPLPTLMTVLGRLVEKGFLACRRPARNNLYTPLVGEEEYRAAESKTFLDKLYGSSFTSLVSTLYGSKVIGRDDVAELRRFLDELEEKEDTP